MYNALLNTTGTFGGFLSGVNEVPPNNSPEAGTAVDVPSCRNHLGLLSEDVDPKTGELWGNFPQTYSMVGLIISATSASLLDSSTGDMIISL
jgi:hypothetical protein